jgi:putative transposase
MTPRSNTEQEDVRPKIKFTPDDIYKAIADGLVSFDLYRDDISKTHRALVFRDDISLEFNRRIEDTAQDGSTLGCLAFWIEVGAQIIYESKVYTVMLVGESSVVMQHNSGTAELAIDTLRGLFDEGKITIQNTGTSTSKGDASEIFDALSPRQITEALGRARLLEQAKLSSDSVPVSKRTIQRLRKAVREAGGSALDRNLALVSNISARGNRQRKISDELIELIQQVGKDVFNDPKAVTIKHAYQQFVARCVELELHPCSDRTFAKELRTVASVREREGKRKAYQVEPIVWYLKLNEAIHGVRPFQYVHIDHTPMDLLLKAPGSDVVLGRPWLSLAIDAESRAIVGFYLSFDAPSYRSCMMVIRDIVRRHGRLPDMLVTDNGKEFHSTAFQRVCELYKTHLRYRPAGMPRHGSVMERVLGTLHSQLVHNLAGNTKIMKHVRTVTKSVRPENFVSWTLPALHVALEYYFKYIYGTENHPAHGQAPEERLRERLAETGMRCNRLVRYDRTFMIETCPAVTETGTRIVDTQRGVKINHIWYWTDAFRSAVWRGKSVGVRVDPWDVRRCYVLLGNRWHCCLSKLATTLKGCTEIELRYAFDELAKKHGIKKKDLSPERISEWARVLDARNFDPLLRERQAETRRIYDGLGMTHVHAPGGSPNDPESAAVKLQQQPAPSQNAPQSKRTPNHDCSTAAVVLPGETGDDDEPGEFELF